MARKKQATKTATHAAKLGRGVNPAFVAIYAAVARIPKGSVSTYGTIARVAGLPGRSRLVGTALKNAPPRTSLPWHRVITASGKLAFPENSDAFRLQTSRLAREGIRLKGNRVSIEQFGWPQESKSLDELLWSGR